MLIWVGGLWLYSCLCRYCTALYVYRQHACMVYYCGTQQCMSWCSLHNTAVSTTHTLYTAHNTAHKNNNTPTLATRKKTHTKHIQQTGMCFAGRGRMKGYAGVLNKRQWWCYQNMLILLYCDPCHNMWDPCFSMKAWGPCNR